MESYAHPVLTTSRGVCLVSDYETDITKSPPQSKELNNSNKTPKLDELFSKDPKTLTQPGSLITLLDIGIVAAPIKF